MVVLYNCGPDVIVVVFFECLKPCLSRAKIYICLLTCTASVNHVSKLQCKLKLDSKRFPISFSVSPNFPTKHQRTPISSLPLILRYCYQHSCFYISMCIGSLQCLSDLFMSVSLRLCFFSITTAITTCYL